MPAAPSNPSAKKEPQKLTKTQYYLAIAGLPLAVLFLIVGSVGMMVLMGESPLPAGVTCTLPELRLTARMNLQTRKGRARSHSLSSAFCTKGS